jgi:hypothetical protein
MTWNLLSLAIAKLAKALFYGKGDVPSSNAAVYLAFLCYM